MKYRLKIGLDAFQLTDEVWPALSVSWPQWLRDRWCSEVSSFRDQYIYPGDANAPNGVRWLRSGKTLYAVYPGMWIVRDLATHIARLTPSEFEGAYEAIEDAP